MDNYSQKKCGFCGENIPADTERCPYCGSILEVPVEPPYRMPEQQSEAPVFGGTEAEAGMQGNDPVQPQDEQNGPDTADQGNAYRPQDLNTPPQYGSTYGQMPPLYGPANTQNGPAQPQQGAVPPQYGPTPPYGMGQGPGYGQRQDYGPRPYYPRQQQPQSPVYRNNGDRPPLSNGLKVFLTMLFTWLPFIGQIAGIITAIVFMSTDGDEDRRSFGVALLVATLVVFVLMCLGCFLLYSIGESLPF